ncbi:MAG: hypothetical protein KGY42_04575 [Desulfobacterales bacterium]|nr:hypothetical protein [Desulfobacterales bacterium]MBS3755632.1 hypothetical protein [Desulfobacterales bacterium]
MKVDVSIGELVDKVTILHIKSERIADSEKLKNIRKEFEILNSTMNAATIESNSPEYRRLYEINSRLWDIEDAIREKEAAKAFDRDFIELARSVYFNNDERAAVKREINLKYGSDLVEEKSYQSYS